VPDSFRDAIEQHQSSFGLGLSGHSIECLNAYYELVLEHNPLLHLVAPCSPEEFAVRHILESLTLLKHLPSGAKFADVGTGAGLPSIPCLIARDDLNAILIESKEKKTKFLEEAISRLDLTGRATVINKQFDETSPGDAGYVACRALDKYVEKLSRLIKWSGKRRLLLFGGPSLGDALARQQVDVRRELMPLSERRYLYIA
jgi:16S rRNA (guanine527-N7)-methyltransferase